MMADTARIIAGLPPFWRTAGIEALEVTTAQESPASPITRGDGGQESPLVVVKEKVLVFTRTFSRLAALERVQRLIFGNN